MQTLTRAKPVLMIVEDAHWIDPSSLEVFGRVVDRIATFRALLIVTYRPEFEPPWVGILRNCPYPQSANSARTRRHDRPCCW